MPVILPRVKMRPKDHPFTKNANPVYRVRVPLIRGIKIDPPNGLRAVQRDSETAIRPICGGLRIGRQIQRRSDMLTFHEHHIGRPPVFVTGPVPPYRISRQRFIRLKKAIYSICYAVKVTKL
jgi:hypothetical protein